MAAYPIPSSSLGLNFTEWVNENTLAGFQQAAKDQTALLEKSQDAYESSWTGKVVSVMETITEGALTVCSAFTGCCIVVVTGGDVSCDDIASSHSIVLGGAALIAGAAVLIIPVAFFIIFGAILPVTTTIGVSLFVLGAATLATAMAHGYFEGLQENARLEQKEKTFDMRKWQNIFEAFGGCRPGTGVEAINDLVRLNYFYPKSTFGSETRPSDAFDPKTLKNCAVLDINLYPLLAKGLIWSVTAQLRKPKSKQKPYRGLEQQLRLAELLLRRYSKDSTVIYSELYDLLDRADSQEEIQARALATLIPASMSGASMSGG